MSSKKGGQFERDICTKLSLWWTGGKRDDVFWRTAGSGARATTRSKQGKKTFGLYGDIQAVDPIGQPLMDLCTFELKRGYKKWSVQDILDKSKKMKKQPLEEFLEQARQSSKDAGTDHAVIIARRDQREAIICMDSWLFNHISEKCDPFQDSCIRFKCGLAHYRMVTLLDFCNWADPEVFINLQKLRKCK